MNNNINLRFNDVILFLIAFCIPFYNISINNRSIIFYIFFLILFLFFAGLVKIRKKYPLELFILIFLCFYKLSSIIWSIDPIQTKEVVIYTSIPILIITIFLFNFIKDINDLNFLLKIYTFACFILSVFVLINFFFRPETLVQNIDNSRITAFNNNPNEASFFLLYGIITLFYLDSFKKFNKKINNLFLIIFLFAILLTGSRTGFANLILILLFLLIIKKKLVFSLVLLVFIFFLFNLFINELSIEIINRYLDLTKIFSDHPDFYREGYRGWIAINGLSNFFDKNIFYQLFGIGYDGFGKLMYEGNKISISHHNQILGYLVELGFLGLIVNLVLFTIIFKKVLKLSKHYNSNFFLFLIPISTYTLSAGFDAKFFFYFFIVIILKFYEFLMLQKINN